MWRCETNFSHLRSTILTFLWTCHTENNVLIVETCFKSSVTAESILSDIKRFYRESKPSTQLIYQSILLTKYITILTLLYLSSEKKKKNPHNSPLMVLGKISLFHLSNERSET